MSPEQVVRDLYAALNRRDANAIGALVEAHFADDVVLYEPASLPWGGTHEGRKRVGRMFAGMAAAPAGQSPMDPEKIEVERVAAGPSEVAVLLRFPFAVPGGDTVESGAVEWFTFADGRVTEVRAVYLDSAALVPPPT